MKERNIQTKETSPDSEEGSRGQIYAHYKYRLLEETMFIEKTGECHVWITYVYDNQRKPTIDRLGVTINGYCLDDYVAQLRHSQAFFPQEVGLDFLPSLLDRIPTKSYVQGYENQYPNELEFLEEHIFDLLDTLFPYHKPN